MSTDALTGARGHQYGLPSHARTREDAVGTIASEGSGEPQHGRNPRTGRFLPGHRFWAARASSGPAPKFADAESLWKACVEYFEWVEDNPIYETQLISFQGLTRHEPVAKMRPMSQRALCLHLDIQPTTWRAWRGRPDLALTIDHVESVLWDWNFGGAAVGLLDATIVARQLGLANSSLTRSTRARAREKLSSP